MAVIVTGIAGASVAHHFHQFALLAQPLNITVFEEEVRADFWIKSAHVYGELFKDIEVGAVAFLRRTSALYRQWRKLESSLQAMVMTRSTLLYETATTLLCLVVLTMEAQAVGGSLSNCSGEIRNVAVSNPTSLPDCVREDEELCHVPTV